MNTRALMISGLIPFVLLTSFVAVRVEAWVWPLPGNDSDPNYKFVTSDFGPRLDPSTAVWEFHYGVDIRCDS